MKVSFIKIIKSDYLVIISLVIPIVMIAIWIDAEYFGFLMPKNNTLKTGDFSIYFIGAIISICVFVPLILWRIKSIFDHFKNGIEVIGKIVYLRLFKDRGRVEYEYNIGGQNYRSGTAVHRNKFVNALVEGQDITIIVSKKNFKKGLIKEMFVCE